MPDDNVYLNTVDRLEPNIAMIDPGAYYASAAISLKRIADALEKLADEEKMQGFANMMSETVFHAIRSK